MLPSSSPDRRGCREDNRSASRQGRRIYRAARARQEACSATFVPTFLSTRGSGMPSTSASPSSRSETLPTSSHRRILAASVDGALLLTPRRGPSSSLRNRFGVAQYPGGALLHPPGDSPSMRNAGIGLCSRHPVRGRCFYATPPRVLRQAVFRPASSCGTSVVLLGAGRRSIARPVRGSTAVLRTPGSAHVSRPPARRPAGRGAALGDAAARRVARARARARARSRPPPSSCASAALEVVVHEHVVVRRERRARSPRARPRAGGGSCSSQSVERPRSRRSSSSIDGRQDEHRRGRVAARPP